jgi:very-short-patch-repair endonuclease
MRDATVRVCRVAEQQFGVISYRQLRGCGLSQSMISRWAADARIHRYYPGVYTLGHRALTAEGRLVAALLYAGPGAVLSHHTAAWWWSLLDREPATVDVSAPGRRGSLPEVTVHHPRHLEAVRHRRFPITGVARTLLDSAAGLSVERVRRLLAEADYRRLLDFDAVEAVLGRGQPGSATLRQAAARHRPELAFTKSELEEAFIALCERGRLPMPLINTTVMRELVDAQWPEQRVIVEVDGKQGHGTPAQIERDRARDLKLRTAAYTVLRYSWKQVKRQPAAVISDLAAVLGGR